MQGIVLEEGTPVCISIYFMERQLLERGRGEESTAAISRTEN